MFARTLTLAILCVSAGLPAQGRLTALADRPEHVRSEHGRALTNSPPRDTVVHTGTVELTPAEAWRSAREVVRSEQRRIFEARGTADAMRCAPRLLPSIYVDRVVDRWVADLERRCDPRVLDRRDVVRDHGFGPSFQTRMVVEHLVPDQGAIRTLRSSIRHTWNRFLGVCGGTLGLWAVLALAFWWLDRLSRGYMTGRLALLSLLCGVAVPAVGFMAL